MKPILLNICTNADYYLLYKIRKHISLEDNDLMINLLETNLHNVNQKINSYTKFENEFYYLTNYYNIKDNIEKCLEYLKKIK